MGSGRSEGEAALVAGHFGFAAMVKSRERLVPLWALMLATQWLDVIFVPLFAVGVERLEPVPGTMGGYGNAIIHADYTHSLVGAALIAVLTAVVCAAIWNRRIGAVLGAVVFSHWILDLVVHRADMPLLPGGGGGFPRLGFGLWRVPAASAAVELALVLAGAYVYFLAASDAERSAGGTTRKQASLAAAVVLVCGLVTLTLDMLGY
jgi:hypothetical protein